MSKRLIIEIQEGETRCSTCPFNHKGEYCWLADHEPNNHFNCEIYDLSTMRVVEEERNETKEKEE